MTTITYTAICRECPPGQRGPERDSAEEAASDLACDHVGKRLEIWITDGVRILKDDDGNPLEVPVRSVEEVAL